VDKKDFHKTESAKQLGTHTFFQIFTEVIKAIS